MINIIKNASNYINLRLAGQITYVNPKYIFEFEDINHRTITVQLTDESAYPTRFNKFLFIDGCTGTLYANGKLDVYESQVDASVVDASMNLLSSDLFKLIMPDRTETVYDPSISYTDYAWDPCSGQLPISQDFVFDPIWESGNIPLMGVPAAQIIQDASHRFVSDSDVSTWNDFSGATLSYVDGSLYARDYMIAVTESSSFTIALTNLGKCIRNSAATAVTCYVPTEAAIAFPLGSVISIQQVGAGVIEASANTGVTLYGDRKTAGQYKFMQLWKTATDEWNVIGGTT